MVLRAYLISDHVVDDAVCQTPFDEIQLGYGSAETLKLYPLSPAKRIEQFLRVTI